MSIIIRPSAALKFDDCPRGYEYQYQEGWRNEVISSNLVFGTTIHKCIEEHLKAQVKGQNIDLVELFEDLWEQARSSQAIAYNATMDATDLNMTGQELMSQFPEAWEKTGLMPLIDGDGIAVEKRIMVEYGKFILSLQPDIICMTPKGEVAVVDFKTPATASSIEFARESDQLTAYQIGANAIAQELGFEKVSKLGFMELIKKKVPKTSRGKGPYIAELELVDARSDDVVRDYIKKLSWMAEDIERKRFPKRAKMAYNSPCTMCDYQQLCLDKVHVGLIQSKKEKQEENSQACELEAAL